MRRRPFLSVAQSSGCRAMTLRLRGDPLFALLMRLEIDDPSKVALDEVFEDAQFMYRARYCSRWTYVTRALAIRLRASGALWSGHLARDPCAVA